MNHSEPTFHELVNPRKIMFWGEGQASQRRTYLVPLADRTRFVAFGVLDPLGTVHFVARGAVQYHLEAFIAQMREAGARVEITPQPPVPKALVMKYVSNPPLEVMVYTPPPPPDQPLDRAAKLATLWREGDATTRHAFILPLGDQPSEFLAFGMIDPPGTVHFVAQGSVRDDLELFLARMLKDEARVELCAEPPAVLRTHLEENVPGYADKRRVLVASSPTVPPVLSLKQLRT